MTYSVGIHFESGVKVLVSGVLYPVPLLLQTWRKNTMRDR